MNAKKELMDILGPHFPNVICAHITYNPLDKDGVSCILKEGFTEADLDRFFDELNFDYDNGYGAQELYGTVWLNKGAWLTRGEYDGSEWWQWHQYPSIPDLLKADSSFPEPDPKDIDCPSDYPDGYEQMMMEMDQEYTDIITDERDIEQDLHPEYIIASTNLLMQETMVFCANAEGYITSFGGLTSIALRHGHEYWEDAFAAVVTLNTDEYRYIHVRTLESDMNVHNLFRRINVSDIVVI